MNPEKLINKKITIQVSEPWDWDKGILTGRITDFEDDNLIIELTKIFKGDKFQSKKLYVQPRYQGDNIMTLIKEKRLNIGGLLIKENSNEKEYVLIGSLRI